MLIAYNEWNPKASTLRIIEQANEILEEYGEQGYDLSLRQLYYQFVSRDLLPNTERSYKNLGATISKARDAGMIDWDSITDRGRSLYGHTHYTSGEHFLEVMAKRFHCDLWEGQDRRVQVWVEKEALADVVHRACSEFDVDYFPCKGYMSSSAIWSMARRMVEDHNSWLIIHLGDHDPSGIDMSRDIEDRLFTYSSPLGSEERPQIEVRRIALNMDQVDEYGPPPNPAKLSDTRAGDYISRFGSKSWELDALEPGVIVSLIQTEIESEILDYDLFQERIEFQKKTRRRLREVTFD